MQFIRYSGKYGGSVQGFVLFLAMILFLQVAAACTPTSGPYQEYYVSPTGMDAAGRGAALDRPWRTIQYAIDHADTSGAPVRIHLAAGTYTENLTITRRVILMGASAGDPTSESGLTIIEPATPPVEPTLPYHTVSGPVRVELFDLVFNGGRLQATQGTLYLERVWFWRVQGWYGLRLRDVGAFNLVDCQIRTGTNIYADYAVEVINSIGEIQGGFFGDQFDHVINITRYAPGIRDERVDGYTFRLTSSHVTIDGATIKGSNIYYADGIRISFEATATIRNSQILRDRPDAEAWRPGSSDGSAAGIDIFFEKAGQTGTTVRLIGNTIAGFDTGIAMNLGGKRVIASGNDISGVAYPVKTHTGRHPEIARSDARIDFGGGMGGSTGGNIFRNVGGYAILHQMGYEFYACNNTWEVPDAEIENRIYDRRDDPGIGPVYWGRPGDPCGSVPEPTFEN